MNSEPNSAVPNDAPIWRKKFTPAVALPMSRWATEFCVVRTSADMMQPMPRPSTVMDRLDCPREVVASISDSRYTPAMASPAPMTGKGL